MKYFIKPYMVTQAINEGQNSGTTTLDELASSIASDILENLPNTCPKCVGTGRINATVDECDYCFGWGAVAVAPTIQRSFSPLQTKPSDPSIV